MNNPYDENNQQMGYGQEPSQGPVIYPEPPAEHIYQGSPGFASASLSMGILSLVSMCCFPPELLLWLPLYFSLRPPCFPLWKGALLSASICIY